MSLVVQHFNDVVDGVAATHRAARGSLTTEYSRGMLEGRNFFLTQLSDRVDELEGDGDLSIVRRWVMKLRRERAENELGGKAKEDQEVRAKEVKPERKKRKKRVAKVEVLENGQRDRSVLEEWTRYPNLRKRYWEKSEDGEESERCRKRIR